MFKRGVTYKRDEIALVARPSNPPTGGDCITGYARIDTDLYVFMNIGVPGRTGHNFDNHYDARSGTLIWFGKPDSKSQHPTFRKLMSGELRPLFFARWKQDDPFTFLGTGSIISFEDNFVTEQGHTCIKLIVAIEDIRDIIAETASESLTAIEIEQHAENSHSSFMFERHLEDFLVKNWRSLPIGNQYDIYEKDGAQVGQQFRTSTGPIDILALNKNKSDFLVVELKRDRASDPVIGQTTRYMGWVEENLCTPQQSVNGLIIAHQKDENLRLSLSQNDKIRFLRYEVDFRLVG